MRTFGASHHADRAAVAAQALHAHRALGHQRRLEPGASSMCGSDSTMRDASAAGRTGPGPKPSPDPDPNPAPAGTPPPALSLLPERDVRLWPGGSPPASCAAACKLKGVETVRVSPGSPA